jgi:hypothetical protein
MRMHSGIERWPVVMDDACSPLRGQHTLADGPLRVSRLTAPMDMGAGTKTPPLYGPAARGDNRGARASGAIALKMGFVADSTIRVYPGFVAWKWERQKQAKSPSHAVHSGD